MIVNTALKSIAPVCLTTVSLTQTSVLIGSLGLSVGEIGFTVFSALYLFQQTERVRFENKNKKILVL